MGGYWDRKQGNGSLRAQSETEIRPCLQQEWVKAHQDLLREIKFSQIKNDAKAKKGKQYEGKRGEEKHIAVKRHV
ncbi:hypothetical protein ACH5RR_031151 [Cinchona calisaya]|uniref:Uncharacterized protein n=1 Tax=Cinchona calisaya TaxID=153742 RepID=A0ABD2YED0_9GENT